jgi:4-aminobutyrate aminotransferase-like enzyme/Ser/Thr protein kinase RdoA (MazF antagonist)
MILEHRPDFSSTQAQSLAKIHFGIDGHASDLPSDRDQNFVLQTPTDTRYVLKIANAAASGTRIEFENEVIRAANDSANPVSTPHLLPGVGGSHVVKIVERGNTHLVRMLTWLDGKQLALFRPHTPALFFQIGACLGRLAKAVQPIVEIGVTTSPEWDLRAALETIALHRESVSGSSDLEILDQQVARFVTDTVPLLEQLPQQVVFNDANDYNILVSIDRHGNPRMSGLIDFGDAATCYRIADLAIASAYGMMDKGDPLAAACSIAAGFCSECSILEQEADALFDLICMRLCTSVVLSASRAQAEPHNEYVTISQKPAWTLLQNLSKVHPNLAKYRLRQACGFEANPASDKVRQWLVSHVDDFASVCEYDLRTEGLTIFDISPGSIDPIALIEESAATRMLFERIESDGSVVGIGRYNEPRLIYDGQAFEIDAWSGKQNRTIHIGTDVFLSGGCPVYAPLPGIVQSVADDTEPRGYGPVVVLKHEPLDCPPFYTLYGHLGRGCLDELRPGDRLSAGDIVGHIGKPNENGGWTPHLHLQIITDLLGFEDGFYGVAPADDRAVWLSLCPDPNLILGIPSKLVSAQTDSASQILKKREALLAPSLGVSYDTPLHIVRGIGTRLYDDAGRSYLDCVNNVCHVGHAHPKVVKAAADQMRVLNTNTRYLHDNLVRYAERLTSILPDSLDTCFFVNSGSEANDLAIRIATQYTHSQGVVVLDGAYHGNLSSLVRVSPYKYDGPGGGGRSAGVYVVPMPDPYRGLHRGSDAAEAYAEDARATFDAASKSGGAAAFLFESILSCGGQIDPPPGFLKMACASAREAGLLCLADEVQIGFGRVGVSFWGFERQGIIPDIVTMGKPIGNGHPIGAVVTTRAIADSFANGMEYFNTYGGNPVSCAVGLAVLDVIEDEALQDRCNAVGGRLKRKLLDLAERHQTIGDVRGSGLFLGVELVLDRDSRAPAPVQAKYLVNRAAQLGVLLSTDGPQHNVIKIKPPIVFSDSDADELVRVVDQILVEDPSKG